MSRLGGVGFSGYNMSVPTAMSSRDRSLAELLETLRRNTALQHDSAERKKDRKFQEKQQKKAEKAAKKKQLTGLAIGAGAGIAGGAILGAAMAPAAAAAAPAASAGTTAATTGAGTSLIGTPVAATTAAATAPTAAPGILGASGISSSLGSTAATAPTLASASIPTLAAGGAAPIASGGIAMSPAAFTPAATGSGLGMSAASAPTAIGGPGIVGGGIGAQEAFAAKYAALNGLSAPTATSVAAGSGISPTAGGAALGGGVGGSTGYSTSPPPAPTAPSAPTAPAMPRVPSRLESALVGGALGGLGAVSGQNLTGAYTGHLADMPLNAARIGLIGAQMGTENAQMQTELQRARKVGFEGDTAGYEARHADQYYGGRALEAANNAATVIPLANARMGRDDAAADLSRMRGGEVGQRMRHADTMLPFEQDYLQARTGAAGAAAQLSGLRGRQIGAEMIRDAEMHPLKMRSEEAMGDARFTGAMRNAAQWYDTLNPIDGGKSTSNRYTQGPIEDQLHNRWGDVSTEGSGEDIAFRIADIGAHESMLQGLNTEHGRRAAAATVAELRRLGAKDDDIPFIQEWTEEGITWKDNPAWLKKRDSRKIQWTPR